MIKFKVEHPNGYTGIKYRHGALVIFDKDGYEVIHAYSSKIAIIGELYNVLANVPMLVKEIFNIDNEDL